MESAIIRAAIKNQRKQLAKRRLEARQIHRAIGERRFVELVLSDQRGMCSGSALAAADEPQIESTST